MKVRDKLYKKWLITRNYVFLNKYKLYRNKIAIINKIYRDCFYNDILIKSDNTRKMWDNINLLINKKRPSSQIEKLQKRKQFRFAQVSEIEVFLLLESLESYNLYPPLTVANVHLEKSFCVKYLGVCI
ncbi:unnamed protein product, partial [Porites lobata]